MSNQDDTITIQDSYVLIIEWDGTPPPTKWYRRLAEMTGNGADNPVRGNGDKTIPPIHRRHYDDAVVMSNGVIIQEGVIICPSKSLSEYFAHLVTHTLVECGLIEKAPTVAIGKLSATTNVQVTERGKKYTNKVEQRLSKRGRKPKEESWVVTCTECLAVNGVQSSGSPLSCPSCGGLVVHTRRGHTKKFRADGRNVFSLWLSSRFSGAHFEPALVVENEGSPLPNVDMGDILNDADERAAVIIEKFATKLAKLPREDALIIMDALFSAFRYRNKEERQEARIEAVTYYISRYIADGFPPVVVPLVSLDVDLFDAACVLGKRDTFQIFTQYMDELK